MRIRDIFDPAVMRQNIGIICFFIAIGILVFDAPQGARSVFVWHEFKILFWIAIKVGSLLYAAFLLFDADQEIELLKCGNRNLEKIIIELEARR
jgi:hypothetical protein